MATKKQRQDAVKKREKRSRVALIACGVLFFAVGAYEVPSILAMMNKKPPVGTTYDPGPSLVAGGLPNVASGTTTTPAASAASKGDLVDTDVPPASADGQLVSFSVFQTKNPFAPQVKSSASSGSSDSSAAAPTTASKAGADVPAITLPGVGAVPTLPGQSLLPSSGAPPTTTTPAGTTTTPTTTTGTTTTTAAPQPAVTISVNGVVSRVSTDGTFPTGAPVFRLAGYGKGSAKVGIVGGSLQAGDATLTLQQGVPVTLQNTTDGKQYKLLLLSTP